MATIPTTTATPLKCPECGEEYAKATGLGRHRQAVHGIAGSSKTVEQMRVAKKTGTGALWVYKQANGQYRCPECKKLFEESGALGSHRRLMHGISGIGKQAKQNKAKPPASLKCPECGKKCPDALRLGNHRWTAHRIRGTTYDATRARSGPLAALRTPDGGYQCSFCDFKTERVSGMGMHLKMHRRLEAEGTAPQLSTPTPTERTAIVKANQDANPNTNNGHTPHTQAEDDRNHRIEAAATFASGRVAQLLENIALQHDLPYKSFATLVLRTVAATAQIR